MGKKLVAGKEDAYLSYKLAKIVTDAPIELDLEACLTREFDPDQVLELFRELEFRSLSGRLIDTMEDAPNIGQQAPTQTVIVRSVEAIRELAEKMAEAPEISFDVETTGLDERKAELVGICLAVEPGTGYYIPVGHLSGASQNSDGQMTLFAGEAVLADGQLGLEEVLNALRPALTNPDIPKIAHNAKYDYAILERYRLAVSPLGFDTMIAEWLTDPGSKHLGLKDLAFHRLGVEMTPISELIGKGRNQRTFAEVPIESAAPYGAADADLTLRLAHELQPEIEAKGLSKLLDEIAKGSRSVVSQLAIKL